MNVVCIPVKNYIIASIGILNCECLFAYIDTVPFLFALFFLVFSLKPLNRCTCIFKNIIVFAYSKFIYPKSHNVYMSVDLLCMLCDIFVLVIILCLSK